MTLDLTTFKKYIPAVTIEDARIQLYLDDAARVVKRDGFDEAHLEFDELQRFCALALMQDDKVAGVKSATAVGNNPEGINSIGVAGINIGFQSPDSSRTVSTVNGKIGYYIDYMNLKKRIWAYQGRVA